MNLGNVRQKGFAAYKRSKHHSDSDLHGVNKIESEYACHRVNDGPRAGSITDKPYVVHHQGGIEVAHLDTRKRPQRPLLALHYHLLASEC